MTTIIDYDTGNLRSVCNALQRIGVEHIVSDNPDLIRQADHVVMPGVGEASSAMQKLRERGLCELIRTLTQPVLGICIGMQLMCEHSEEGNAECLGIFPTRVKRFVASPEVKVPHMGWNQIRNLRPPLFSNVEEGAYVYFVHSYAPMPCSASIAISDNGTTFSAALHNRNFFGTQFHPEKSGSIGEQILKNFIAL
ncbi:MAG: imidazole glycerol phosphate synthase subunit HisH [Bacteroidales bacterium]|nr:imidazole glycerol phosphate synthase subunit HisH [Bacteroidales bacterium]